ncbi:MAG: saccharopine dehydrogenase, partial [Candidatus Bipolaricaulota bacterium]|nr:saccharopine dehydrogenase [Candidatus Bipolaricaulota bacterium]
DIAGPELFAHHWPCAIVGFGELEVYPNRDSLPYIESYGIPTVTSMFRGTLRYPGWCTTLKAIADLGMLDDAERADLGGRTFAQWMGRLLGMKTAATPNDLARKLGISVNAKPVTDLVWLGLTSSDPLPRAATTDLDVLAQRMLAKMQYAPGERDMLVMQHEFVARYDDRTEKTVSTLVDYGIPNGDTSMSRLVGLPAAIAARMILEDEIDLTGVQVPTVPAIYEPVLKELATLGVRFTETTSLL